MAYLIGGFTVGVVAGLASPIRRSGTWGRVAAGILAATPAYFAFRWGFDLPYENGWKDWLIFLGFVLVFGVGGVFGWTRPSRS